MPYIPKYTVEKTISFMHNGEVRYHVTDAITGTFIRSGNGFYDDNRDLTMHNPKITQTWFSLVIQHSKNKTSQIPFITSLENAHKKFKDIYH